MNVVTLPGYGAPIWHTIPDHDPRKIFVQLMHDALSWRLLNSSPHVADLISEWVEWDERGRLREASHAVAGAAKERAERGWRPSESYEVIAQRRAQPGRLCLEFRERHGSVYTGGAVVWESGRAA